MLVSNTFFSNDPTLNPLNAASHNVAQAVGHINKGAKGDPSCLHVPNQDVPLFGSDEWNQRYAQAHAKLVPPNQDIPLGDQLRGSGFIPGHSSLFRLSNGAILDFKARKIIFDPESKSKSYWGDPNKVIQYGMSHEHAPACQEFDQLIAKASNGSSGIDHICHLENSSIDQQIDSRSAQYWLQAEEEAEKLMTSMTDDQKRMIADFEQHFPKSRLIEESKKAHDRSTI